MASRLRTRTIDLNRGDNLHRELCWLVYEWSNYPDPAELNSTEAARQLVEIVERYEIRRNPED